MEPWQQAASIDQTSLMMSRSNDETPPENTEIAILVRRTIDGETSAFGQIMTRYERRVLTLATRLLGTVDDAQDAAQEVFLRAFRYLHRLDLRKPIEPWL